jgi:hypothetical protein
LACADERTGFGETSGRSGEASYSRGGGKRVEPTRHGTKRVIGVSAIHRTRLELEADREDRAGEAQRRHPAPAERLKVIAAMSQGKAQAGAALQHAQRSNRHTGL